MAITSQPGYIVDPTNPNAVIKDPGSSQSLGGVGGGSISLGATNPQPIAATTPTPAPQLVSPTAPSAPPPTAPATATAQPGQATMPATGSIVDLLNTTGANSSYQDREQLAQQYGIQNYTGTGPQNTELAQKYLAAYNATKGQPVPQSGADGRTAVQTALNEQQPEEDPQKTFFEQYMSMNPVVKTLYDAINQQLSTPNTQLSFREEYSKLLGEQGIPGLQTELMDINRIMEGTEDDIRDEITKVGGFATESQVQGLKAARNKTLLKQANSLQQQLALKQDYVNQIMQFSQLDRAQIEKDIDRKLGLTEKLATLQVQINDAAKGNYQDIIKSIGYSGFANLFSGNPVEMNRAETILGLPSGALTNKNFLDSELATKGPASVQEYQFAIKNGYKGTFNEYQTEDANRKIAITRAGVGPTGLSTPQYNALNQITTRFQADPIINQAVKGGTAALIADQIIANPSSAANQLKALYVLVKNLDPESAVREGELALANETQSYWQKFANSLARVSEGRVIAPDAAVALAQATKELMTAWNETASKREQQYNSQATTLGVGNEFASYVEGSDLGYHSNTGSVPDGEVRYDDAGNKYVSDGTQWVLQEE